MPNVLVTGANRGIGLELVRQLSQQSDTRVFAACRDPEAANILRGLAQESAGRVTLVRLHVDNSDSITEAVAEVQRQTDSLDLLINNAAINPPDDRQGLGSITRQNALDVFSTNVVGVMLVTQAFLPLLMKGTSPRIVNISSDMGSIEHRSYGGSHLYCASKSAVNMFSRGISVELRKHKITCIALDPGWVKTDMGGSDANLEPVESVQGMVMVINRLTLKDTGSYLRWDGTSLPW
jgi:NAD(P)-dependent dehydrogenase (short-subunit alcohol dehydrogenase family)